MEVMGQSGGLLDGPFNDLQPWQYGSVPEVVGVAEGLLLTQKMNLIRL